MRNFYITTVNITAHVSYKMTGWDGNGMGWDGREWDGVGNRRFQLLGLLQNDRVHNPSLGLLQNDRVRNLSPQNGKVNHLPSTILH